MTVDAENARLVHRGRVTRFFLVRLALAALFLAMGLGVFVALRSLLLTLGLWDHVAGRLIGTILLIASVFSAYALYLRLIEKRRPSEYSLERIRELGVGAATGAALVTTQVLFLWIGGYYHVTGAGLSEPVLRVLFISLITGFAEELVGKGVLFRICEEGLGSWVAMLICFLEVGATHWTNPGASTFSTLAVGLEFGVMLALFFMLTRRLWLVTGFHVAWNFTLGGVFGINVSGTEASGILTSTLDGPPLLTGGSFGPEASLTAVVPCAALVILLIAWARRKSCFVKAPWNRPAGAP